MTKTKKPVAKRAAVKKVAAKKPAAKRAKKSELLLINRTAPGHPGSSRRAAASPKKAVRSASASQYKHHIEVRKTERGDWSPVGAGGNDPEAVKKLARIYASNYPNYWFRVI